MTRNDDSDEDARATPRLGDLLYSDRSKAIVSETEWIELVQRVSRGDQRALYALYERAHRIVFTFAVRIIANRETAEEVTLDVLHDVWRRAVTYDPANGSVIGWIMNQARSRAIDRLRLEQRKKRTDPYAGVPQPTDAPHGPEDALDAGEEGRRLREALSLLSPDERQVIETAFFSDLTYAEVATRLGQPLGTVKTRVRSGLGKLRRALAQREE